MLSLSTGIQEKVSYLMDVIPVKFRYAIKIGDWSEPAESSECVVAGYNDIFYVFLNSKLKRIAM